MDPLASLLADELACLAGGRHRILAEECTAALVEIAPQLRWDPTRRARLRALLAELEDAGRLSWSVARDDDIQPDLPTFVRLTDAPPPRPGAVGTGHPWRPELEWVHQLDLTRNEFDLLLAVQDYRKRRPHDAAAIPHRERSLQVFGDEKRLDRLARSRLFAPGRLRFELLDCWWAPPPLAHRVVGLTGPVVVSENSAGFHSLPDALSEHAGIVAYGAGGSFAQSSASLAAFGQDRAVLYIGDLDAEGIAIPQRAAAAAIAAGAQAPKPFAELWHALVRCAPDVGQPVKPLPGEVAAELCEWFGSTPLADAIRQLLQQGVRVAQEALTAERVRAALA